MQPHGGGVNEECASISAEASPSTDTLIPDDSLMDATTHGGLRDNRFFSRKLPGVLDWMTFPTVLPNSGLVGHHPFEAEIDHFIQCVLHDVESHASLHNVVNTHAACFAISESSQQGGRPVTVPLLETSPA